MAVIVGDKLKLSNYSYLLQRDGKGFVGNLQSPERRDREEKLIDAVDIDWRPFRFKNFSYVSTSGKATYTYVTEAGDLFDTERLIDWISYSYSMGKNLDFYGYIFHNRQTNLTIDFARPTMLTNIGWVDKDSRIIGYTFWPAVGSISKIKTLDKTTCDNVFINTTGEIFNDYVNNEASGTYAHAEGYMSNASGNVSHAEGFNTYAEGNYAHSEGVSTHASGDYSHASGYNAIASGSYSFAHGDSVKAEGIYSTAFGFYAVASGSGSFANAGGYKIINGKKYYTWAAGTGSHAEGIATYAGGDYSHTEGDYSYATASYSHAEGERTMASGESSHAEGESTEASGKDSHSEGISTIASGDYSHAEGSASQSQGLASHAEGQLSDARGAASHAEGFQTIAIGDYSHAEGESTTASGNDSHAEGYNNTTAANCSHIEGSDNRMNEFSTISHVEGYANEVNNSNMTHVEGESNVVTNSNTSHIGGDNNNITGTSSSIIFGSDNKTTSSRDITVFGVKNEVTAKKSAVIGTLSKIQSDANYSQVFGTNSYSTKSYVTIVGNNTYSSGSYSILIGDNIGTAKENSTLLGTYISVGNNSSVPVSVGRNIFSGYESPLSIGINITNNGRSGSTTIGYGLLLNNVNGQKFIIGKFNEALPVGYQFALGDGTDNSHRHNAFVTTDNNWTYITALATYINNITFTEQNVAITYETNFVHIKSFNDITRGIGGNAGLGNKDTNTYNLNFNTYVLPTKRYVDKLLAAKDVFRFAGTFTPTDTTWTTNTKDHTVRGNWKPSVVPRDDQDNDEQYSYSYSDKDFSAGAVWKVTSTGWFGSTYVMGGDLVISYDDAAISTNDKGWAVIDTQIAFMENYGTYSTYKGNGALLNDSDKDLRNFFITNINLSDTGYLTYTYAGILAEYRTDSSSMNTRGLITKSGTYNNKKFLSNISLIRHDDRIELAYTYTDFYSCYTTPGEAQYTNIDVMENENLQFVYDVYLSPDGILSYSKYTMRGFKHHHHLSNAYNWSYVYLSYDTGDDLAYIVSNIHFTYDGHLSYTYTVLSNLRNHHTTGTKTPGTDLNVISKAWSYTPISYTAGSKAHDNAYTDAITFLDGVNLDSAGTLTYHYTKIDHLRSHHRGRFVANVDEDNIDKLGQNGHFAFVDSISLSPEGELTATSKTVEIPDKVNDANHSDESDHSGSTAKFDHTLTIKHGKYGVSTSVLDKWDGSSDATVDLNNHGTKPVKTDAEVKLGFESTFNVVTDVKLDSTGYLSPTITPFTIPTRSHHTSETKDSLRTFTINTLKNTDANNSINVITGITTTSDGHITATTTKLIDRLNHHGGSVSSKEKTTDDPGFSNTFTVVKTVSLSENGQLSGTYQEVRMPTQSHHSGSIAGGHFVVSASISSTGTLSGSTGTFSTDKTELTSGFAINTGSSNNYVNVLVGINLDSTGKLTYIHRKITDNLYHHNQNSVTAGNFVSGVSLSGDGVLTRSYGNFTNSHNHTGTVATRTSKGDKHTHQSGDVIVLTYNYIDGSGKITNRYETIELKNSIFTLNDNENTIYNNPNPTYELTFTRSLTLTQTDGTGAGSKNATITRLWDNVWESNVT